VYHLFAYAGAKTDSTANEAAPAVSDQTLTRTSNGGQYLIPFDGTILFAAVFNDTITRARLNYPSYRDLGLPEVFPLNATAEPSADLEICLWGKDGPRVRQGEEFGVDTSNGASTVDNVAAIVALMKDMTPIPPGRRFTVRGTAAQTLVANAWTSASIALDQTLPYGRYGVIGMAVTCNDGFAGRLIFPGQNQFRPGVVAGETTLVLDPRQNGRAGQFGLLGTFDQTSPPQLEILGGTAGAETPAVILDLVEISRGQN
jgi:hypothetical protein